MSIAAGVRVEDMGHKMGCNGVDNGKLWFNGMYCVLVHVWVMYANNVQ